MTRTICHLAVVILLAIEPAQALAQHTTNAIVRSAEQTEGRRALPLAISARTAASLLAEQAIQLIDIRRPEEWQQTGVAVGAYTITMHQKPKDFLAALSARIKAQPDRQIAVICRTGGRTAYLQGALARVGVMVINVRDGMLGNTGGPGWVRSGLPVVPYAGN